MLDSKSRVVCLFALTSLLLFSTHAAVAAETPGETDPDHYQVLIQGNEAGEVIVKRSEDEIHSSFSFNDRGRGPELDSTIRLGEDGLPVEVHTTGHEYFEGAVDETFRLAEGKARWRNRGEAGSAAVTEPAFYLSFDGTPVELPLLARTLLADEDRELALLPAGSARIATIRKTTVSHEGVEETVRGVAVEGLGFSPTWVWLREDGTLFARISGWFSVVPENRGDVVSRLQEIQEEAQNAWHRELADELGEHPAALAFTGATLFDPAGHALRPDTTVVVRGNRITAVGADGTLVIPDGARVIDAAGRTVLPGLWDMHTHVSDIAGPLNVAAGVTTIRDLANDTEVLLARKARWDTGEAIGPRVILAGFMDGPGPYAGPTKVLVDTAEEARKAIDRYAESGHEQIKIYSSIDPELVPAIAEHAHARGLRLSGHIPAFMTAEEAVRAGFDEIQHVNMLFLNFFPDVKDTRTPARFTSVAERAADLDLDSEEVQAFFDLLDSRDVVVDPTVGIFESMFLARQGSVDPQLAAVADRLPATVRRGTLGGGLPVADEAVDAKHRASFQKLLEMVRRLHEEGIPIVAGTDALAGFTYHRELELSVEAGIPAAEVLRIATLGAAEISGRAATLGSVTPGKLADLVLVPGNPVDDISVLRKAEVVVKDGVLYHPDAIYRVLGVSPGD